MGWMIEMVGTVILLFIPVLRSYKFHYLYFPDAIVIFVMIPFIHVMNEEEIKGIVMDRGWTHGLRHLLGQLNKVYPM